MGSKQVTQILFRYGCLDFCISASTPLSISFDICLDHLLKFAVAVLLLATVTEVVQLRVPASAVNPLDLLDNVMGVAFGIVAVLVEDRKSKIKD